MELSPRSSNEGLIRSSQVPWVSKRRSLYSWEENCPIIVTGRGWTLMVLAFLVSLFSNIVLGLFVYHTPGKMTSVTQSGCERTMLTSPVETAISKKLVKFRNGIHSDTTPYQGYPTPEKNLLWEELYGHEMSLLSYQEALLLPNKTSPDTTSPESGYPIVLNVFHNLHCLDSIRKAMYYFLDPRWSNEENPYLSGIGIDATLQAFGGKTLSIEHVDHCIDALRQDQICAVDTTPNVFQYSPKDGEIRAMANVIHECRDFDKVKSWASLHRAPSFGGFGDGDPVGKCALNDSTDCLNN